jgi:signal transduction histidine kinase
MQHQTGGRQMGWQEPEISIQALQPDADINAVPGSLCWMETVSESTERILTKTNETNQTTQYVRPDSSESLSALLHDTRNMVASISLYCELLEEPGVLTYPFRHYASELRLVAGASHRLLERMEAFDLMVDGSAGFELSHVEHPKENTPSSKVSTFARRNESHFQPQFPPSDIAESRPRVGQGKIVPDRVPVVSLADELHANRGLISALIGPHISLALSIDGGDHPIAMTSDDLTRVLVNLASNAAQAMPKGGHIQINLRETARTLHLTFADNGPGIPDSALETVFTPGYTTCITRSTGISEPDHWPVQHRGLGLPIVRSLVAAAGGSVWATTHAEEQGVDIEPTESGAVFRFEFPIQN